MGSAHGNMFNTISGSNNGEREEVMRIISMQSVGDCEKQLRCVEAAIASLKDKRMEQLLMIKQVLKYIYIVCYRINVH